MRLTLVIARRELTSFFYSPVGYVVMALFAFTAAMLFFMRFATGAPAHLRDMLGALVWTLMLLTPPISMRLISDEFRSGTIESLMTSPLSDAQVVVGKWLGALAFYAITLAVALGGISLVLWMNAKPSFDFGPWFSQMLGLLLVGSLYLAIGAAASACTQNQIIAFLVTAFILGMLTIGMYFLPQAEVFTNYRGALDYLNATEQFGAFNKGVIDTSGLMYYVSGTALFLFIATKLVETRRWT